MGVCGLGNLQECKDNFFFLELDGVDNIFWSSLVRFLGSWPRVSGHESWPLFYHETPYLKSL
jgi:hypothetical protein